MRTFHQEGAAFVARLEAPERAVLLEVVDDVVELLDAPTGPQRPVAADEAGAREHAGDPLDEVRMQGHALPAPVDPAVLRLLPHGSEDAEVAAEFRRLTEGDLRSTKSDQLLRLRACIDAAWPDLVVVPSEAPRIAAALTDVRLVTSERLSVRTDADADALYRLVLEDADGPDGPEDEDTTEQAHRLLATVYVMLSLLQESLVELMIAGLEAGGDDASGTASGTAAEGTDDDPDPTGPGAPH
ncbi:DUF2017 family protein [Cellulomonas carbonis]|uniref:Uncharacterized protein n=1 Tax=Cellulomonas carbonis T26 TaxID=947969 RepID=A0A0A0BRJ6_9CELL|nr:DUF2017 family protein [Cellulomonas carbonis]KGM10585.1 hypothetical protein N868_14525 [Cellulomonas carbonis T26]GGB98667.1 hypothetical protein GCM10010972_09350 [Cellulomonas carbonis]